MAASCKMPEEMVVQILTRLPPKTLTRFKCVRKSWYALINDPQFVNKHLHSYNEFSSSTRIFFKRTVARKTETTKEEVVFSFLDLPNDNDADFDNLDSAIEDLQFPVSMGLNNRGQIIEVPSELDGSIDIIGQCDGILCLILYTGHLVLYNPSINEYRILPDESSIKNYESAICGFGNNLKSIDYVLVSIASSGEEAYGDRVVCCSPRAEVYTMSSNSWREIKTDYLETETTQFWPYSFEMNLKGKCYWMAHEKRKEFISYLDREQENTRKVIVFFDTSDEVFLAALFPACFYRPYEGVYETRLGEWNKSVALFGFHDLGLSINSFHIWVMDDCGDVTGSWTKHLTFEMEVGFKKSLTFWKSDEILMVAKDDRTISFNLGSKKVKHLPIHGVFEGDFEVVVYTNSIVPINRRQQD